MKDYSILDELVSKTQELHRAIFDKGYEQGQKDTLEQKEKTGKWIDDADKIDAQYGRHSYKCPKCGKYASYFVSGTEVWWDRIKPNFCPNCGEKKQEE